MITHSYKKIIGLIMCIVLFDIKVGIAVPVREWQETQATFKIIKEDVKNLKLDGTVLGILVAKSGKQVTDLLDNDGKTLSSFSIHYKAPVKLTSKRKGADRDVTQYGLYRMLDAVMRTTLEKHHHVSPMIMKIRYDVEDPTSFEFVMENKLFQAPVLVSDDVHAELQK